MVLEIAGKAENDAGATEILVSAVEQSGAIGFCDPLVFYSTNIDRGQTMLQGRIPKSDAIQDAFRKRVRQKYWDQPTVLLRADNEERIAIIYRLQDFEYKKKLVSDSLSVNLDLFPVLIRCFCTIEIRPGNEVIFRQDSFKNLLELLPPSSLLFFAQIALPQIKDPVDAAVLNAFVGYLQGQSH